VALAPVLELARQVGSVVPSRKEPRLSFYGVTCLLQLKQPLTLGLAGEAKGGRVEVAIVVAQLEGFLRRFLVR